MKRYLSISSRIERLYPVLHGSTFKQDLIFVSSPGTLEFIKKIQSIRNDFIHGEPEKITDSIVNEVIQNIEGVQQSWIMLYNLRCVNL